VYKDKRLQLLFLGNRLEVVPLKSILDFAVQVPLLVFPLLSLITFASNLKFLSHLSIFRTTVTATITEAQTNTFVIIITNINAATPVTKVWVMKKKVVKPSPVPEGTGQVYF
jgi:hypothetical protein